MHIMSDRAGQTGDGDGDADASADRGAVTASGQIGSGDEVVCGAGLEGLRPGRRRAMSGRPHAGGSSDIGGVLVIATVHEVVGSRVSTTPLRAHRRRERATRPAPPASCARHQPGQYVRRTCPERSLQGLPAPANVGTVEHMSSSANAAAFLAVLAALDTTSTDTDTHRRDRRPGTAHDRDQPGRHGSSTRSRCPTGAH